MSEKTRKKDESPDYAERLMRGEASSLGQTGSLRGRLARVPDFSPPAPNQGDLCPPPATGVEEQSNAYHSSGVFLKALAAEVRAWRKELPANYRPAVIALLYGGMQIHVRSLAQVSFDGIRIEGTMEGSPCSLLAHQATVQMLCYAEEVEQSDEIPPKRPIGFIWPDQSLEV